MSLTEELRQEYAPGVPYTVEITEHRITDLLENSAKRYPQRKALDFFSRSITYSDFVTQVRQGAQLLHNSGVRKGDRVALLMPNCPQHAVAVFAILFLGAIVVEQNPLSPAKELEEAFANHGAKTVIAWENIVDNLKFLKKQARVFTVDITTLMPKLTRTLLHLPLPVARKKLQELSTSTPKWTRSWDRAIARSSVWKGKCPSQADDVAVLLHTGGTTGTPKAAALTHKNLVSNVNMDASWVPDLHEGAETMYCVLPLFHAFGFSVSFLAGIRIAATIALFPKFDTSLVLTSQKRLPCTFLPGVAPMYQRLLDAAEEHQVDLTSIRFAVSGAMPLDAEVARTWEKTTKGLIIEGYGMTEASPIILGSPLSKLRRPGALGIPYPSTEIRIVDPDNLDIDVEDGEVGELIARGPQIFPRYWEAPEETEEAFHKGWLRTGDLVRLDNGFIVMADRRKEMINSSGFKVFPSQVEDAVRSMPGISDVAVVGLPDKKAGESIVAAIVLESGASVTLEDLRTWAERSIAHYALPRQIVVLNELPRSQIGKVMRRKVRDELLSMQTRVTAFGEHAQAALSAAASDAMDRIRDLRDSTGVALSNLSDTGNAQQSEDFKSDSKTLINKRRRAGGVSNPNESSSTNRSGHDDAAHDQHGHGDTDK